MWVPLCHLRRVLLKEGLLECVAEGVMGRALKPDGWGRTERGGGGNRTLMFIGTSLQRESYYELVRMLGYTHVINVHDKARGFLVYRVPLAAGASLALVFQWLEVTRGGGVNWPDATSSVQEYHDFAQNVRASIVANRLGRGDVVVVMTAPYDIVHRPLAAAEEGADVVARGLASMQADTAGPLVVFRNSDAIHLPWLSYGRAMRTPQDGMTTPRSEQVSRWFARAMAAHRVPVLETFAMTAVRGDQSRDGIHYRTTRDLATNSVPRTVLQVLLQALCASA